MADNDRTSAPGVLEKTDAPASDERLHIYRGENDGLLCNQHLDAIREELGSARPRLNMPFNSAFLVADLPSSHASSQPVVVGSVRIYILDPSMQKFQGLPNNVERAGEIKAMLVLKEHRQKGVARKLLAAVEDFARDEMGLEYMALETWWTLKAARTLYERAGYRQREVYGQYDPRESVCYEKWL